MNLLSLFLALQLPLGSFAFSESNATAQFIDTTPSPSPFSPPLFDDTQIDEFLLFGLRGPQLRRRDKCKDDYHLCGSVAREDACCPGDTVCAHDENGNLACCPNNAVCTGAIPTVTMSVATVPGAPYPFYYIPTSYVSARACESAYSYCNSQYTHCTSALADGEDHDTFVNPVQISVADGQQLTLHATPTATPTTMPAAEAKSVCSSLRSRACYDLQEKYCTAFGTDHAGNQAADSNKDNSSGNLRHPLREGNANDIVVVGVVVIAAGAGIA